MRSLFRLAVQAGVTWILMRGLVAVAVSSGTPSRWALAAATATVIAVATVLGALLTRQWGRPARSTAATLLPVPFAGAVWTVLVLLRHDASVPQTVVAAGAWVVGGLVGWGVVSVARRRRSLREEGMVPDVG